MKDIIDVMSQMQFFHFMKSELINEVGEYENKLGVQFADDYKKYVLTFGVVSGNGHELTGICTSKRLNVVDVTIEERKNSPDIPPNWYVIERTNIDDIVIWQSNDGKIYLSQGNQPPVQICRSLLEYLQQA